jgi:hypothetical protein
MSKIKLNPSQIRAGFVPNTFNEAERTVEVVWTTGAKVKRYSWDGPFFEELSVKKDHVRMERLNSGAPVLNNHDTWRGLNDVIGVVEEASIKGGEGRATLRLSNRPEIAGLVEDIKTGIIRNISVGYVVHKFEEIKMKKGEEIPTYRAIDWEPMELSFVAIPADYKAQARSEEKGAYECEIITTENEERTMNPENEIVPTPVVETPVVETPVVETPVVETPVVETPVVETPVVPNAEGERSHENLRQREIREVVRTANLPSKFADTFLNDTKATIEDARKAIIAELARKSDTKTNNHRAEVNMENQELRKRAAVNGLLHRFDPKKYSLSNDDREFRQDSIIDLARKYLDSNGVSGVYNMTRRELVQRALHSTSDFPEILANVANKIMRDSYEGVPNTFAPFVTMRNAKDFKELTSLQMGNGGTLQKVGEHGEYKRTTLGETAEKFKVEKFGLIIGRTYELMMNDDLDAFSSIPQKLGVRAREKENQIFWDLFLSNPVMAETGNALFHASHNNLGTASLISIDAISAGRASMRLQKDLDGELASVKPAYIIVPAALETKAEQFLASVNANQNSQVNPFSGKLQIISEARLDAASQTAWFLAASAAMQSIAEMAYLDGAAGPEITTREGFDIDGMEVKIRHHFGMKFVDYRGLYKNAGL